MREWDWETNNRLELDPRKLTEGSNIKVWWICPLLSTHQCGLECTHRWEATINDRARSDRPRGCPYCRGGKNKLHCFHMSLACRRPDLMLEWDWITNSQLGLDPRQLTEGSNTKVWWVCSKLLPPGCQIETCVHRWEASIANRTHSDRPTGCPYCNPGGETKCCIHTSLGGQYPEIASQWHSVVGNSHHENGQLITQWNVTPGSHVLVNWYCSKESTEHCTQECSHIWTSTVNDRTNHQTICPWAGCCKPPKRLCIHMSLVWKRPHIAKEWDSERNVILGLDPTLLTENSHIKVWWKCVKGHSWEVSVNSRIGNKTGCPFCVNKTEAKLLEYLQTRFTLHENLRFQYPVQINNSKRRFDFVIISLKLIIELDGPQHLKQISNWNPPEETRSIDIIKMLYAWNDGYSVVRLLQEEVLKDTLEWRADLERIFQYIQTIQNRVVICYSSKPEVYREHITDFTSAASPDWKLTPI